MQARQDGSDASPPRRRPAAASSPDASPPRRSQAAAGVAEGSRKGEVMQSGANAGLVRGQELKEQLLRKQQVTVCFTKLSLKLLQITIATVPTPLTAHAYP